MIFDKNILLGISEKKDGSMKGPSENYDSFFQDKKFLNNEVVKIRLLDSNQVLKVEKKEDDLAGDALISDKPNLILTLTVADCLPIYFYDPIKKLIALAHAGWRGLVAKIPEKVIASFSGNYNSASKDILVFIGPHIQSCCFEVQEDVARLFKGSEVVERQSKKFVDLSSSARQQLVDQGVKADNIKSSLDCTHCLEDKYFSFRRDKPQIIQTMTAYIMLK